jgi:phosphatidylserine/phosphatidylglycerophosphate/cardiolipin synthase-like enzyme
MLLEEGSTCWRVATAPRAAFLLDMADYFMAAREAMKKAKRSIHLLNWAFEPDTLFEPQPGGGGPDGDRFANFLRDLACGNPELDVRILCWKSALPVAATQNFFPLKDRKAFAGTPVRFVLDDRLPTGASHHQKVIVIDDTVAFCGGGDIGPDRWDTPMHLDDDPRRKKAPSGDRCFDSRHEVMSIVDGPAAAALGELFRARWLRATQEQLPGPPGPSRSSPWPACVKPDFRDVAIGLSRTYGKWRAGPEVRESEELYLASIAGAKRRIYLENQYFTSPIVAEALAQRLAEPRGPEVILVSAEHSPSYFDQMTMDRTRSLFIQRLKDADRHGRLHAYSPVTTLGRIIIVHAKLAIIDDVLLRVGSSNLNNRSAGFDSECDLSLEASGRGEGAHLGDPGPPHRPLARLRGRGGRRGAAAGREPGQGHRGPAPRRLCAPETHRADAAGALRPVRRRIPSGRPDLVGGLTPAVETPPAHEGQARQGDRGPEARRPPEAARAPQRQIGLAAARRPFAYWALFTASQDRAAPPVVGPAAACSQAMLLATASGGRSARAIFSASSNRPCRPSTSARFWRTVMPAAGLAAAVRIRLSAWAGSPWVA